MHDYYRALEIARTATADEIKTAFRSAAQKHHPDKNQGDPEAGKRFQLAREAYEVLGDPDKRKRYDMALAAFEVPPASAFERRGPPGPTCDFCGGDGIVVASTGFLRFNRECPECFGLGTCPWREAPTKRPVIQHAGRPQLESGRQRRALPSPVQAKRPDRHE